MSNHIIRIQELADLFIQKYHADDFSNGTVDYGVVRKGVGFSHCDHEFFFSNPSNNFSVDDFELFKSLIYGVGKSKFRYNERIMNDYNHSQCKNILDIFISYQEHIKDHSNVSFDFYSLWVKLFDGERVNSVVFSDVGSAVTYRLSQIISKKASLLLEPFNIPENLTESNTQLIIKDYQQNILFSSQNDLKKAYDDLNTRLSLKIKSHFKDKLTIIVDDSSATVSYIFPSNEVLSMMSLDSFYENLKYFELTNIKQLYDFIDKQTEQIYHLIESAFHLVFNEHKILIDKELEKKRHSTYFITNLIEADK